VSPLFSVIMPNYNGGSLIGEALESIRRQTCQDYEVIVVDDGSTDNSRDVIEAMKPLFDGKLRYVYQPNQGCAAARNTGLRLARGEYIAFLDTDDLWKDERLQRHAEIFRRHPDVGFCCSNFLFLFEDQTTEDHFTKWVKIDQFPYGLPIAAAEAFRLLLRVNFVGVGAATVRRSCVQAVGEFDQRYRQAEDYDFWLRCAMVTNFYVLRETLHFYRVRRGSLSSNWLENMEYNKQVIQNISVEHDHFVTQNKLHGLVRGCVATRWYDIGNLRFERGQIGKAFASYLHGLFSDPALRNVGSFLSVTGRKSVRMLTFGRISRKPKLNYRT
jgi:glycosyltransferase involved in cell wall biosynthesis